MGERGWQKELTTAGNKGMHNDYQGCLTDICPVGALTFNDFRFEKRVWFLKKAPSVCDRCSKGCNIFMDSEHELIYRYRPRHNAEVNGYWMCDEGRKSYHDFMNPQRVVFPMARSQSEDRGMHSTTWDTVLDEWYQQIKRSNRTLVLIGTDATIEEAEEIQQELASLVEGELEFRSINGTNEVKSSEDDEALDHLLRRKDKTPNTKGLESLGINPCEDEFEKKFDLAIVYRCGRALAPPKKMAKTQVAWGLWTKEEIDEYELVVPGLSTAEKEGTFINCDGIVQRFEPAIKPCGKSKGVSGALLLLSQRVDEKARLAHGVL
jgi:NADH-quinone oxidoreductase subunit G